MRYHNFVSFMLEPWNWSIAQIEDAEFLFLLCILSNFFVHLKTSNINFYVICCFMGEKLVSNMYTRQWKFPKKLYISNSKSI